MFWLIVALPLDVVAVHYQIYDANVSKSKIIDHVNG